MRLILTATLLMTVAARADTTDALVGLDEKVTYEAQGVRIGPAGHDSVLVLDLTEPLHPRARARLAISNSVFGPPSKLSVSADGTFGLVASSVTTEQKGGKYVSQPTDEVSLIDLEARPPVVSSVVHAGWQPSGLAIAHDGTLALVANRAGHSVSVVRIEGKKATKVSDVAMGDSVAAVAITPDGKHAYVCKDMANKVAILDIDGVTVTYDPARDIPTAFAPFNVAVTPDGIFVLVVDSGLSNGNTDTIAEIDTRDPHQHVVSITDIGASPKGLAISPSGRSAVVPLLLGSAVPATAWNYTRNGAVTVVTINNDGTLTRGNTLPTGSLPESVLFDPSGNFVYVFNFGDQTMQIFRDDNGVLSDTSVEIQMPGPPASAGGAVR